MERYFTTITLLGLNDGNLPVHRGTRQKRYDSIEKMLDLTDVVRRIGPKFPLPAMFLDPFDPEWDDDMTYLFVDWGFYSTYIGGMFLFSLGFVYNYNMFFHNKTLKFGTQFGLFSMLNMNVLCYYKYRKQVIRCNLFDEYVQMRADELIKEREHLLRGHEMTKWVWYTADLQETLLRCHRQAYNNDASDFADSELLLQDFIRRYTDDTALKPLQLGKHRIAF